MSSLPVIRKLHFIILLLLGGTVLAAGDFSCGKDGTATAVFWRNAMLLEPWFDFTIQLPAETTIAGSPSA